MKFIYTTFQHRHRQRSPFPAVTSVAWHFARFPAYIIIRRHTKVLTNCSFSSATYPPLLGQLYRCPESGCEKEYKTEHLLRRHLKVHRDHRDGNLKCPHCEKTFCRADYLEIHIKRHLGQKDEKCPECGKGECKNKKIEVIKTGN